MQREEILKKLREQGRIFLLQRNLLQSGKTRFVDWYSDRLPYDKYIGGYRCNQQKYHVPH